MKTLSLCVCAVLMAAGIAQAGIMGSWSKEIASPTLDRWVLTLTPTGGTVMDGFDIRISDPGNHGWFKGSTAVIFESGKNLDTSFLLNTGHLDASDNTVDDLVTAPGQTETTNRLGAAFAWTAAPGNYAGGWANPLEVAEIIVNTGAITNPYTELRISKNQTDTSVPATCSVGGTPVNMYGLRDPEPSTLVLLVTGLLGLAAYAWRKRKQSQCC